MYIFYVREIRLWANKVDSCLMLSVYGESLYLENLTEHANVIGKKKNRRFTLRSLVRRVTTKLSKTGGTYI